MVEVSGFVLAGGRSQRMGTDKALLRLGERTFLEIALDNAGAVCPRPIIVGPRSLYAEYGEVIEDFVEGCGPLGGIHAALSATTSELNLIMSVDMPLMEARFLQWLVSLARTSGAGVTVPRSAGRLQPLCAVYRRYVLRDIEAAIARKQYKVEAAFMGARVILEGEIEYAGFSPDIFRNVNQLWEYEGLARSLAEIARTKGPEQ